MTEEETRPPGKTTVAPDVLINIAALTTLSIDGVSRMSANPSGVNRLLHRGQFSDGIRVTIENSTVHADIHVILNSDVNIRQVSRNIQREVARAISEMVGMDVGKINIHIEDIDYQEV
jgi:uncharacterized alkaline shock family protein YloU